MSIDFKDRVAVVTGAGGGLGRTYALELAKRGCKVVVNDPGVARDGTGGDSAPADQVVAEIQAAGGEAVASHDGVETEAGGQAIVAAATDTWGRLDVLIHNAGILRDRSFAKMTADEWKAVLAVHLDGGFNVSNPAFKVMKAAGYGRMLMTTSVSGLFGNFGQASYGAAKMGLVGLMNVLTIEGKKYDIKVNGLSPTAHTRMTGDLKREGLPDVSRDTGHVTAAAVFMVSEACQDTGVIIHAGHGFYGRIQVAHNDGVFLGREPTSVEDFADNWGRITAFDQVETKPTLQAYMGLVYDKSAR